MLLRFCLRMPLHVSRDANVGNRPRAPYQTKSLWSLPKLLHRHRLRGFYSYCTKKKRCALPPSSKLSFCPCNLCLSSCNGFYYTPFLLTYVDVLVVTRKHQTSRSILQTVGYLSSTFSRIPFVSSAVFYGCLSK